MTNFDMVSEGVSLYRELSKYPEIRSARVVELDADHIDVETVWTQRCLEKKESHKFRSDYIIKKSSLEIVTKSNPQLSVDCIWNVTSPSGKKSVVVRKHIPDKSKPADEKWHFEIWSNKGFCEKVVDVSACDKHGAVYNEDGAFGSLAWNCTEEKIVYIAEKKKAKTCSYFDETKKSSDEVPVPGIKFISKNDWGEMLVDKEEPAVCVLDIATGEVKVINDQLNMSCGQALWCPGGKGVVFSAFFQTPFRLGIVHCPIRRSILYYYDMETSTLKALTNVDSKTSVRSARFSPDGSKMVYLEAKAGGPHCVSQQLKMINWANGEVSTVVDILDCPLADADFHGIYCQSLPLHCWNHASSHVILSTSARSVKHVFSIDVSTGYVTKLTNTIGCWGVKDIYGEYILAAVSYIDMAPRLAVSNLKNLENGTALTWTYLDEEKRIPGIKWQIKQHKPTVPHPKYDSLTFESIVLQPTERESKGLIVFPHGGPHSVFSAGYQIYFVSLARLGFTVALVNYRGSTGFGEASIQSLVGYIGDADVKDVHQCALEVLEEYQLDREKVAALGGSHGGFIAAHLIGQYPDFYKAAVIRNPVTNLVSMVGPTDIPDWAHSESNITEYRPGRVPNAEEYSLLYSKSPVAHIHKVKAPTMLMIGKDDRRVPPSQGEEFHKALLSQGVESRMFVYPDNSHPICTVEAESDSFINLYRWFVTHLV